MAFAMRIGYEEFGGRCSCVHVRKHGAYLSGEPDSSEKSCEARINVCSLETAQSCASGIDWQVLRSKHWVCSTRPGSVVIEDLPIRQAWPTIPRPSVSFVADLSSTRI